MSDLGDLFANFYNQFLLRDLLSMIMPGFTIIFVLSKIIDIPFLGEFDSPNLSIFSIIIIFSFSYILGILLAGLSDTTKFLKTYYGDNPTEFRKKLKEFYQKMGEPENYNSAEKFVRYPGAFGYLYADMWKFRMGLYYINLSHCNFIN